MNTCGELGRNRLALLASVSVAVIGVGLTPGCSVIPEAQQDPTRFFVLSTAANVSPEASALQKGPKVRLRPIELASYARGKAMIVRRGSNELEFRDFARWSEPLEQGITRVLREELLARGASEVVGGSGAAGRSASDESDFDLTVRVLACEGEADGGVNFRAVWELARIGPKAGASESVRGNFRASGLTWDGKNEAALAARLSEAVSGLAEEIAGALKP